MKKLSIIITLLIGLVVVLGSCQKEEKDPVLNLSGITAPAITQPEAGAEYVLTLADSAKVIQFAWSAAVYNASNNAVLPAATYSLEMGLADSNFVGGKELVNTQDLSFDIIYYNMNTKLLQMGVEGEQTVDVELRVSSLISGTVGTDAVSEVIKTKFTTFNPPEPPPAETPRLWVPGDYQGWNPAEAPNVFSEENNGVYQGYVYYPEGGTYEFKFTSAPDWDHTNFGYAGEGTLDTDPTAGNLSVPDFGGYWLTCDTVNLTWSYEVQNWGVIGSGILGGDWSEDVDLVYDATANVMTVTIDVTEPQDGGDLRFKFRANDGWDTNLGLVDPPEGKKLSYGGPDIPMPEGAGNYTFILDFNEPVPVYDLIKN